MKKFPLIFHKDVPVFITESELILVDTGSPVTLHTSNELFFLGEEYSVQTNMMGVSIESISGQLGYPITTLLGNDILSQLGTIFDYQKSEIRFFMDDQSSHCQGIALSSGFNIPIISVEAGGKPISCYLDTGAGLSYLDESITDGIPPSRTESDFHPLIGNFETKVFLIETEIAGHRCQIRYGNLPGLMQPILSFGGVRGILGSDFFKHFRIILHKGHRSMEISANS